ncbi:MAG: RluA family pseudouridine synthase [Firmicutes bacterium]|nr:RluA family pseudouridine synthase [Bacillota bacterium]
MEAEDKKTFIVSGSEAGNRADVFLVQKLPEFTRSRIKLLNDAGMIEINGSPQKSGYLLRAGDIIDVEVPEVVDTEIKPENLPLNIVYQDSELLVINKAQGMVTHPAVGNYSGTLVNALLYHVKDLSGINGVARPGIVHRLDKNTSGLMLVAKTDAAHLSLAKQIAEKTCKREYVALLEGEVRAGVGIIENYIGRDKRDRFKMAVVNEHDGRAAKSEFAVIKRFAKFTLVRFKLVTGRTHQIRVHARFIGHPVVGDEVYNPNTKSGTGLKGQLLHSAYISFVHPVSGKTMEFNAELPDYFSNYLAKLD